ncbi:MAG: prepilin peptidase [Planctomycetota bacterium]
MNLILAIPLVVRLAALFVCGVGLGAVVNRAVYGLATMPRCCHPWLRRRPEAPPRAAWYGIPIVGWLGMRQESVLHGRFFWLRPMVVELAWGLALPALYWWETVALGLLPIDVPPRIPAADLPVWLAVMHMQFLAHAVLLTFMLAGSLIDIDEKIIPDPITLPATLLGLVFAAVFPWSLLPEVFSVNQLPALRFLTVVSPKQWHLEGLSGLTWLIAGLLCWAMWCFAILPRTWYARHGWRRALVLCMARVARQPSTMWVSVLAILGAGAIVGLWWQGGARWAAVLSALVGMAVASGLIWLVRFIGRAALGREAMGFGDVLLMAMIGAYVGWQPSLFIFFLAPVAGLVIGVLTLYLSSDREIPYGPFLCLAAVAVIVWWAPIWEWGFKLFDMGWFVPAIMLGCMAIMFVLLAIWRLVLTALGR